MAHDVPEDLDEDPGSALEREQRGYLSRLWLLITASVIAIGCAAVATSLAHGGPIWPHLMGMLAVAAVSCFCSALDTIV